MKLIWWLGFSCQYQDGMRGEDGVACHTLIQIKFKYRLPQNWGTSNFLEEWKGVILVNSELVKVKDVRL